MAKTIVFLLIGELSKVSKVLFSFSLATAIATICGYLAMFIQGRIYCQRYYPIERNILFEFTQVGLILVMLLAMTYLASTVESIYMLALFTFGLAFVFPLLNFLLGFFTRKELGLLMELARNVKKYRGKSRNSDRSRNSQKSKEKRDEPGH